MTSEITEPTTNPAAARVQLIEAPVASPGVCILCGKSQHPDGFADAKLDFEFYGSLYLCGDCVGDFARIFGWIHPRQAQALAYKVNELDEQLRIHREALLNLESAVEHLTDYKLLRNSTADVDTSKFNVSNVDEGTTETDDSPSGTVVNFPGADSSTESNPSEFAPEQGSDDVPGSTSNESSIPILDL